jgi:DNA invertase Pin-like site-specific DNA recombinase
MGDTLVVWRLDRLGRSMLHLVTVIAELGRRQGTEIAHGEYSYSTGKNMLPTLPQSG